MKNYKIEELKLMKENGRNGFMVESRLSLEEKLEFLDVYTEGKASKLYNVLLKFKKDKESLKKDSWGNVKTISLVAWIRKNNDSGVEINTGYKHGRYYFIGSNTYSIEKCEITGNSEYGNCYLYTDRNIINQWYHDLLVKLQRDEMKWNNENDPLLIKINKLIQLGKNNTCFDNKRMNYLIWNGVRDNNTYSHEELDSWIKAYEDLNDFISNYKFKEVK